MKIRTSNKLIDVAFITSFLALMLGMCILTPNNAYAFSKLKNGFETLTTTYLIPLSHAVAGASLILYVIVSYFKLEEYQKKIGTVLGLSILSSGGLTLIKETTQVFS